MITNDTLGLDRNIERAMQAVAIFSGKEVVFEADGGAILVDPDDSAFEFSTFDYLEEADMPVYDEEKSDSKWMIASSIACAALGFLLGALLI